MNNPNPNTLPTNDGNSELEANTQPSENEAPVNPTNTRPNESISPPASKSSKAKTKSWLLILALTLVLILIVSTAYLLAKNSTKTNALVKHDIPLINYGISFSPLNIFYPDPNSANGTIMWQNQIFEGLVAFQNGTSIKPQLAASWSNPNSTTWIFNLKPNIYYHDGDTVTAQDVVSTWQQISQNQSSTFITYLANTIKNVTAINSSTVQITTTQPDALLLNRLTQLYIIDSKAPKNTSAWELGTGAYTVKPGTAPNANNLDLVAFDRWHGGHAYTRAIDYAYVSSPADAISGLKSGRFNLIDNVGYLDRSASTSLAKNYRVFATPQLETNSIAVNTTDKNSPAYNPLIRKALALSIDNTSLLSQGQQTGSPVDQVVPPTVPGYDPGIKPITRNISEAAAMVKQAGYPNGVTLNLYSTPNVDALNKAIVAQAKPAGINIKVITSADQTQLSNIINSGSWDAFTLYDSTQLIDGSDILSTFGTFLPYNNQAFSTQLNNATIADTSTDHLKALEAASLTLYNDYGYVPMYQVSDVNVSDKSFTFPLNAYDSDLNAYFADVYKTN